MLKCEVNESQNGQRKLPKGGGIVCQVWRNEARRIQTAKTGRTAGVKQGDGESSLINPEDKIQWQENKNMSYKSMFIAALFTVAKKYKQTRGPSTDEWITGIAIQ